MQGRRHTLTEITQITNIPKGTLGDLKRRGTGVTKPRSGRPKKLTSRDIRHIEIYIRSNYTTRRVGLRNLIRILQLDCTEKTVHKALNELGYHYKIARRRCFLSKRDRKRRLQFAKRHVHWTAEDWDRIIWTDEMTEIIYGMAFKRLCMEKD